MTITYRVHPVWLITAALLLGGAVWAHHKRRIVTVTKVEYIRDPQDEIRRIKAERYDSLNRAFEATRPIVPTQADTPHSPMLVITMEKQS